MHTSKAGCLLFWGMLTVFGAGRATSATEPRISFTRLQDGERILIDFRSNGCFHRTREILVFIPGEPARLTWREAAGDGMAAPDDPKTATAILTTEQTARLDHMLAFYHRKNEGACTNNNRVTFTVVRGEETIRSETYEDATCRATVLDARPEYLRELGIHLAPILSLERITAILSQAALTGGTEPAITIPDYPEDDESDAFAEVMTLRQEKRAVQILRNLSGRGAVDREFQVTDEDLGDYVWFGPSLSAHVLTKKPRMVDSGYWSNPMVGEVPNYTWNDFLRRYREVERVAASHRWLASWRAIATGRHVVANITGDRMHREPHLAEDVLPAWRHAGLKGQPEIELSLRNASGGRGTVWVSKAEPRALVTQMSTPGKPERGRKPHWLDGIRVDYNPRQAVPEYVLVDASGRWVRNTQRAKPPAGRRSSRP